MKKYSWLIRAVLLCWLIIAVLFCWLCSCESNKEPYGPEYGVDGIALSVSTGYSDKDEAIPANQFILKVKLLSDNKYAQDFGIHSRMISKIADLKISIRNAGMHPDIPENSDVSRYFLIDDDYASYFVDDLYQTIPQYIEAGHLNSSQLYLYFTNQTDLAPNSEVLVSDISQHTFKLDLTLENGKIFSDQIKVSLKP